MKYFALNLKEACLTNKNMRKTLIKSSSCQKWIREGMQQRDAFSAEMGRSVWMGGKKKQKRGNMMQWPKKQNIWRLSLRRTTVVGG